MPAFQAINLEPEENVDEQIDTTKELHVDEALKRFQHALKLHAQGHRSREAAGAAYDELFESEIFRYREAGTDYEQVERQADGQPEISANEPLSAGLDIDAGGADGVATNLSLALYLSYKNYGQFFLDKLKDSSNYDPQWKERLRLQYHRDDGEKIMRNWTAALDQDPSDPELWRKAARFAASLNSGRIKRYCLEAAIEVEDDPAIMEVYPPSLAEGLAGEQLKDLLNVLGDDMALSHPVIAPWLKKEMPLLIKRHLDPIPFLPDPTVTLTPPPSSPITDVKPTEEEADESTTEIPDSITTWSEMGLELMKCLDDTGKALRICEAVLRSADKTLEDTKSRSDQAQEDKMDTLSNENVTEKTEDKVETDEASTKGSSKDKTSEAPENNPKSAESQQKERSVSVPTRKRSQSAAGLPEGADEETTVEKRSKRVRRRDTAHAEELTDPSTLIANQLLPYQEADRTLFEMTKNILESLGVEDKGTFSCVGELIDSCGAEDRTSKITSLAAKDLRAVITGFREDTARVLLDKKEQATLGLSSFLEHAKSGSQDQLDVAAFDESQDLRDFAEKMLSSKSWVTSRDMAFEWVRAVSKTYATSKWSDRMKLSVVHMLNRVDATLYEKIVRDLESPDGKTEDLETIIPMLFELHIDIYERITNPSSAVDYATRMETKYRLDRWLDVASWYLRVLDRPLNDPLCARFLWASVMVSSLTDSPVREHILLMWTSLRDLLSSEEIEPLNLPNNLVMPLVSPVAADREISKLTTMDFFLGLFQEEMENPIHVIETLEPVLNPSSVVAAKEESEPGEADDASSDADAQQTSISDSAGQGLRDLWKFLLNSSTELRLFLWSKLGDAYDKIDYTTKKFSCHLKGIEMIVADFEGETYSKTPDDSRRLLFMRAIKSLDELVIQALSLALNDSSAFDIIDEHHIRSSTSALAKASSLLHVAALCDDEIRIGISTSSPNGSTFQSLMNKLREMQVRMWCLQYTMFKAGIPGQESVLAPENELADYLAVTHLAIGLRKYCKLSNKIFLKMMRAELLRLENIENWEDYLGQVLYDLHGLKLGVGVWEVQDHGCPHENLEKRQTMQLVEKVMVLANRMPMKDLLKSDLKTTIDHMQQTIGQTKSTPQMIHNLRNFTELLKKPIHPLRLYQALVGAVSVDAVTANTPEAALAKHGWFFLLGMIALTKFKGVDLNRRQTPGATDDLRIGATFLRLQLQFTADNWRAWFRLAECFDYELDEAVLWTADKMNKDRAELVKFQRNAIHCYTLALSHSRNEDVDTNDGDPLHDMYHKFAMRLYASSREPFAMEPFHHSDQERFFIENMGTGTFKRILHDQMSEYKVWKFAAKLFKMAMERQPTNWKNPYMLAKCFWKMHQTPVEKLDAKDEKTRVSADTVLDMLKQAVNVAYNARKSRNSEPILEPHYKMVAVLHKMVIRGDLPSGEAAAVLSKQPFGVTVNADDHFASFSEPEDWEEYVTRNLAKLKDKDKSNWQHRIIMRHAKILFVEGGVGQSEDLFAGAKAAFAILRENMFTKTMVMNVWKCDAERPGRHHVYTEQYVRFMTRLLVIMSDQTNLELLLRRLRKKGADFYHFTDLWQTCCQAYLKLLRQTYEISPVTDDVFKALSSEEFEIFSERITEWASGGQTKIPAFNCMGDAIELKKLNANLMKAAVIDELINDCYSKIFLEVAATLPGLTPSKVIEERNHAKEVAAQLESVAQAEAKAANPLSSILNPSNGQDSAAGTATPLDGEKPEAAPKIRRTGVRRPDVLRKAEQAIVRSQETPRPATAKSRVGSVSSAKRGSQTPNPAVSDAGSDEDGPDAQVRREAGEGTDIEMRDGDVTEGDMGDSRLHGRENTHSDLDNDSDLSDVPDDYDEITPPGLLVFPNLRRSEHSGETSGEEADSESEGDEPGDGGEEQEDEDEDEGEGEEGEGEGEGETGIEADIEDAGEGERDGGDQEEDSEGDEGDEAEEADEEEEEETEHEVEHDSEHDHADDEDTRMGEAEVTEHDISLSSV